MTGGLTLVKFNNKKVITIISRNSQFNPMGMSSNIKAAIMKPTLTALMPERL
jgi:hypothetical protein